MNQLAGARISAGLAFVDGTSSFWPPLCNTWRCYIICIFSPVTFFKECARAVSLLMWRAYRQSGYTVLVGHFQVLLLPVLCRWASECIFAVSQSLPAFNAYYGVHSLLFLWECLLEGR